MIARLVANPQHAWAVIDNIPGYNRRGYVFNPLTEVWDGITPVYDPDPFPGIINVEPDH